MRARLIATAVGIALLFLAVLATPKTPPVAEAPAPQYPAAAVHSWSPLMRPFDVATTAPVQPPTIDPATYDKHRGPNLSQRVVLTYDDCPGSPRSLTDTLAYARDNGIGLVLAPTGECVERFARKYALDIATLARWYGHYAINHSNTHPMLTKVSSKRLARELATEVKSDYGRPPYGDRNQRVDAAYAAAGMREWLWRLDTNDWKPGKTRAKVVKHVVTHAKPGDTVLMHMQHQGFSPAALRDIKAGLAARVPALELCRPFRGWTSTFFAPVQTAPAYLGDNALPC